MASPVNAVLCALVATVFWTSLGYALGRQLLPRALALGAAPVTGWAVQSVLALPIFILIGFTPVTVVGFAALCVIIAAISIFVRPAAGTGDREPTIPAWAYAAAAILALVPAVALLPKLSASGVHLADPIFDHSKIAMIDAMTRQGLPPVDPVFSQAGTPDRLAYYYLWHFSAAELALPLRVTGWEADIGLTWFTTFASLSVMMGLAVWLSQRSLAAIWAVMLAAATSLRTLLGWLFGEHTRDSFLAPSTGFAGWLFQAAWVPQHLMSASCVVAAMALIARYAQQRRPALLLILVAIVVAGFESSTHVGGVTFAIAAVAAAPILFFATDPKERRRVAIGLAAAAVLVVCLAAPFMLDQFSTVAARGDSSPIVIHHFAVLGPMFPAALRRVLDVPAYWLILLPIEFPAVYIAGTLALVAMLRGPAPSAQKCTVALLACLAAAGMIVSWLLASTLGDNNDLGLRAILPAAMVLIIAAASGMVLSPRRFLIIATAVGGLVLSLPNAAAMIRANIIGRAATDAGVFAQSPELWTAVRRYAPRNARVANDPLFLADLTPWPANMSWALLANRGSCFAGRELALALAPLSPSRREAINAQFIRVFGGQGTPKDVDDMAKTYRCDVVVVVPQDKAWSHDPFAASPDYRLAENRDGKWRIYLRADLPATAGRDR